MTLRKSIWSSVLLSVLMVWPLQAADVQSGISPDQIRNFFKSLLIPGWGQLSEGHTLRAGVFVAAEVGTILSYRAMHQEGMDREAEYKDYAAEYWDFTKWFSNVDFVNGEKVSSCGYIATHNMPYFEVDGIPTPYRDHHYYENIGKYPEFICGWEDWQSAADEIDDNGQKYTPLMREYIDIRTASNVAYRHSRVALTLLMVNHLVSAFEAAAGTSLTTFSNEALEARFYVEPVFPRSSIGIEVTF